MRLLQSHKSRAKELTWASAVTLSICERILSMANCPPVEFDLASHWNVLIVLVSVIVLFKSTETSTLNGKGVSSVLLLDPRGTRVSIIQSFACSEQI
jgi:hypothetical protein